MAKKTANRDASPAVAAATLQTSDISIAAAPVAAPSKTSPSSTESKQQWNKVLGNICAHYLKTTPQRTKLLDVFMAFLVAVGAIQFLYCVLAGNYPFNAFLSGFSATVGQFVLTASLRVQTTTSNKSEFPEVSPERAFADFVGCSLILHFFCINFIN